MDITQQIADDLEMVKECFEHADRLDDWEREFLANLEKWLERSCGLMPRQREHMTRIYQRVTGE